MAAGMAEEGRKSRRKQTVSTRLSLQTLQTLVDINPDGAVVCDELGRIVCANFAASLLLGGEGFEPEGRLLEEFIPELKMLAADDGFLSVVRTGDLDDDHRLVRADGVEQLIWCSTNRLVSHDEVYFVLVTMRDVTDRNELEQQLRELTITDDVTGLHNRRFLQMMLPLEEERARRYSYLMCCTFVDIDHFKRINDAHGHYAGDEVLKEVGKILKQSLRKVDVVCRWEEDEFVVLSLVDKLSGLEIMLRRFFDAIRDRVISVDGHELKVQVTCGAVASSCDGEVSADRLFASAGQLLLTAKGRGRNRFVIRLLEDEGDET